MADIELKNAQGQALTFQGVESVSLYDAQGTAQIFVAQGSGTGAKFSALIDGSISEITAQDLAGVSKLRWHAFENCSYLARAKIPEGIKVVPGYCFNLCTGLSSVDLPSSITSIGDHAFGYTDLRTLTCRAAAPPSLHQDAFYGYSSSLTGIYVPDASVSAYKSASGWSEFASIIRAIQE